MPTINKVAYQHANLEFDIAVLGESWGIVKGFDELTYSDSVEREKMRGADRLPIDATDGDYDAEGSVSLHRYHLDYLMDMCAEKGVAFYDVEMTLTVTKQRKVGTDLLTTTDTITRVKFASREFSSSAGADPLMVPCDLFILGEIFYNGLSALGNKLK